MEGAGIMNLPTDVGGPTGQSGLDSYAPLIAAQSTARDMGYPRFTRELLSAGSEIDQAEVQEFLQTIRDAGLTSDDVSMMRRVVEAVFGDPNNYSQVRDRLLAEGVPEDILPETFDLEFFVALRMAVEEAENLSQESRPMDQGMPMDMPVGMAEGGIVGLPQLTPIAREMAAMGRNGDTMLAHITPQEAMMLQRMGGSGTINPYTGLPEFFIGKAFKGLVKGIKKFAKSKVGRIIVTVALGAFLGPAAAGMLGVSSAAGMAAVAGFAGSFGSGLLAGDSFKDSLRGGLTSAALAGGLSAISGGSAALQERPQFEDAFEKRGFFGTVKDTTKNFFGSPVEETKRLYGVEDTASQQAVSEIGTATDVSRVTPTTDAISAQTANAPFLSDYARDPSLFDYGDQTFGTQIGVGYPTSVELPQGPFPMSGVAPSSVTVPASLDAPSQIQPVSPANAATTVATPTTTGAGALVPKGAVTPPVAESTFFGRTGDFLKDPSLSGLGDIFVDPNATGLARYKPAMYAGGIGLLATQGDKLFKAPEQEPGESYEAYMARRDAAAAKFEEERPEFFGSLVPTSYPTQTAQNMYTPPTGYSTRPNIPIRTYQAAKGSGPEGVEDFPRKTGPISGPGTGTSDDIPAMLSDGEFVFTAKAVRNMGGGSRRKGAAKMYKLMKMLEGGPVDKTARA